jgi:hypothetical protein
MLALAAFAGMCGDGLAVLAGDGNLHLIPRYERLIEGTRHA